MRKRYRFSMQCALGLAVAAAATWVLLAGMHTGATNTGSLYGDAILPEQHPDGIRPINGNAQPGVNETTLIHQLTAVQATTLTLNLGLHNGLVSGVTPRPEPIAIHLTYPDKRTFDVIVLPVPDADGGYMYAANLSSLTPLPTGCIISATQGGQRLELTVPVLTALADQSTSMVYGQAPPTSAVTAYAYRYQDLALLAQREVEVGADGAYRIDLSGLTSLAARDFGYVFYQDSPGSRLYVRFNVPWFFLEVNGSRLGGVVAPHAQVRLKFQTQSNFISGPGQADAEGNFNAYLYEKYGQRRTIQSGETIVITAAGQSMSLTAPILTARPDPIQDIIAGTGWPGMHVRVDLRRGPLSAGYTGGDILYNVPDYSISTVVDAAGTYTASLVGLADVMAGDYGAVFMTDPAGHLFYRLFATPFLKARLGAYLVFGQINESGPVTITVSDPLGVPRNMHVLTFQGMAFNHTDGYSGLRLSPGDQLIVESPQGETFSLVIPALTVHADWLHSRVTGQAPPNSRLRVNLYSCYNPPLPNPITGDWGTGPLSLERAVSWEVGGGPEKNIASSYVTWTTSDADGAYSADFSDHMQMCAGDSGTVSYINPEGFEVYREFTTRLLRAEIGSNRVTVMADLSGGNNSLVLLDASGQIKAQTAIPATYYGGATYSLLSFAGTVGVPAIIEPGDVVSLLLADGSQMTMTVPQLTLDVDRERDILSGQAPANAVLSLGWTASDTWVTPRNRTWVVTATATGGFQLDLAGDVDLERGDWLAIGCALEGGHQVQRMFYVPALFPQLGSNALTVLGAPFAPLTLQISDADGSVWYTVTTNLKEMGVSSFYIGNWPWGSSPPYLATGHTLSATVGNTAMSLTLPHLTARLDVQADTISGEAPPGARLVIQPGQAADPFWGTFLVTATLEGSYRLDLKDRLDLTPGSVGIITYLQPDGHRVILNYAAPYFAVTIGTWYISGVAPGRGAISATLADASGVIKATGAGMTESAGSFVLFLRDAQQKPAPIVAGDTITFKSAGGTSTHIVPDLTATFERRTGILSGRAPGGAWLTVTLDSYRRQTLADATGAYALDWSDLRPHSGENGAVSYTDAYGNRTTVMFRVPLHLSLLPLVRQRQ